MSAVMTGCGKEVRVMRHDPAGAAIVIMLRSLKMPGMAQAVGDLIEQGTCIRCSRPHALATAKGGNGRT